MSVKTSPRRMTARRRATIIAGLRERRIYDRVGVVPAPDLAEAYAKTVDLFASLDAPLTVAEIAFIGIRERVQHV